MEKKDYKKPGSKSAEPVYDLELCRLNLSLDRLKKLLDWEKERKKLPADYAILSSAYKGEAGEEDCFFTAAIKIEVYTRKWVCIPLLQSDGIIKKTIVTGGSFGFTKGYYSFIVQGQGIYDITLEFYLPFSSKERKNGIQLTSFGIGSLNLDIPKGDISCNVSPALGTEIKEQKNKTSISTFIGVGTITIGWAPKLEEVIKKDQKAIIHGEVNTSVVIGEALIRCKSQVNYSIYQAGIISFSLKISEGKVMSITGKGIRTYDIKNDKKSKASLVKIHLDYESSSKFSFAIQYEKKMDKPSMLCDIPYLALEGVDRENGVISISSLTNVEITLEETESLTLIDTRELPNSMRYSGDMAPLFSFKYMKVPYNLKLNIKRHEELPVLVCIAEEGMISTVITNEGKSISNFKINLKNNSKQFLNILLPQNANCLSSYVDGAPVKPAKGEKGKVMLALPKLSGDELQRSFVVEIVWSSKLDKMKRQGSIDIEVGTLDVPINKLGWQLFLPENYKYTKFRGNIQSVKHLSVNIPSSTPYQETPDMEAGQEQKVEKYAEATQYLDDMVAGEAEEMEVYMSKASLRSGIFKTSLPVKIDLPKVGNTFSFEKLFVQEENVKLRIRYKKIFRLFSRKKEVKPL